MKKVLLIVVLYLFSIAAGSIHLELLPGEASSAPEILSRHSEPASAVFTEPSRLWLSWASHAKNLFSVIALAEGECRFQPHSASFLSGFHADRPAPRRPAEHSVPSDRGPPALLN